MIYTRQFNPESNFPEDKIQMGGFVPLKDRIKAMTEAGKRLIEHRCLSTGETLPDGEPVDRSLFGKRYYDRMDIAELEKQHSQNIQDRIAYKATRKKKEEAEKQSAAASAAAEAAQETTAAPPAQPEQS